MPEGLNELASVDGEKGSESPGGEHIPKLGIRQTLEVGEITFALDAVLAQAGIRLPQFHTERHPEEAVNGTSA
ncbi:hypothetical protein [Streptomyces eurythermus]|uniref:hypothetical protein n=1 Tax=Streptomyces eurythermus TaxID=42237 RepID=UPI0033CFEB3A